MNGRLLFALFLLPLEVAHADSDGQLTRLLALSLEDLLATKVTISTSIAQPLSSAPSVVSLITAEDIEATGAGNLTQILQSVPGVYIQDNLFGFRPRVLIRGAPSTHTLILVDGLAIKDLVWNAGIYWRGLSTRMIDRVEVIRGPGSALYGSDASAGVINVITKTAGKIDRSEAGMRAGSFDTREGWVQHGGNWNGFDTAFTAELSHTDGHQPGIARDGQTARDKTSHVSYAPGYAQYGWDGADIRLSLRNTNWRMNASYLGHSNVGDGLTGAAVMDPYTRGADNHYDLGLSYSDLVFAKDWALNASLHYMNLDYSSGNGFQERPPGYQDATGRYPDGELDLMRAAQRQLGFETSGVYTGLLKHTIRLGAGASSDDPYRVEQFVNYGVGPTGSPLPAGGPLVDLSGSPYAFAPEKTRRIDYLFLQDVWAVATDWAWTAGARYDHNSDFGDTFNPRLALVWQSTASLTTKLMYGQAFRAPSYLELYSLTAANLPNPKLKPERSKTWDLSFSYLARKDLTLDLDVYQFSQFELIAPDASNRFQNLGNNTSTGVEVEAKWQATKALRVSGNFSSRADDTPYNPAPKQTGYLRADWAFHPMWNWDLQANWTGRHDLAPGDPRAPIAAYTIVDTTLRYSPRPEWAFSASIRNLFDVDARELSSSSLPDHLPLPKRNAYAEVRYKF